MILSEFDYYLPKELIAQYPLEQREEVRLMVINRRNKSITHDKFKNIINYLDPKDILVINKSKVIPARMYAYRKTGGRVEILLLNIPVNGVSKVLVKSNGKLKNGEVLTFRNYNLESRLFLSNSTFPKIQFSVKDNKKLFSLINKIGKIPLPPYIKRDPEELDFNRYQTVYADCLGSVASPTAGLHFSNSLIKDLKEKGIKVAEVILHVSYSTFSPVKVKNIEEHKMYEEYYDFPKNTAKMITEAKQKNRRIIVVGTTSCRVLETVSKLAQVQGMQMQPVACNLQLEACRGWTDLFIYPPYNFKLTDCLITNFHFPKSTLLMLVSAFADKVFILEAYQEATREKYRFYSYGDCMLIL